MAYVDPGELRHVIQIVIPTMQIDANNHYIKGEDRTITARAAVRAIKSSDDMIDGAERVREMLQFIIRWRQDVNTAAAVIFRGRKYEVEFVDPTPFAGRFMRIKAMSYDAGVGA